MANLSFLGTSCLRSLCCVLFVVGAVLVSVAVISSTLCWIPRQYESRVRPSRIEVGLPVYCLAPLEGM